MDIITLDPTAPASPANDVADPVDLLDTGDTTDDADFTLAGRQFGRVVINAVADAELSWFFNRALSEIELPSIQGALLEGRRHPCSLAATEARIEALHSAGKIWDLLQTMPPRRKWVLKALYTEQYRPRSLVRRLGHLVGVVEMLPAVEKAHVAAWRADRTRAIATTAWLEELVAADSSQLGAWREQAVRACAQAIADYQRVRGDGPSVVPEDER